MSFLPNITPIHLSEMCRALLAISDLSKRPTIDQILQECMFPLRFVSLKKDETLHDNIKKVLITPKLPYSPIRPKSAQVRGGNNYYGGHGFFRDDDEFVIATSISSFYAPQSASPSTHRHSRMQHGTPSTPKSL